MQRDPAGYVDGVSLYGYVGSRSLSFVDPLGLSGSAAGGLTAAAAIAAAESAVATAILAVAAAATTEALDAAHLAALARIMDLENLLESASGAVSVQALALRAHLEAVYQARLAALMAATAAGKIVDDLVQQTRKSGKERSEDLPTEVAFLRHFIVTFCAGLTPEECKEKFKTLYKELWDKYTSTIKKYIDRNKDKYCK